MVELLMLLGVGFLALANGANDNFKGVATIYGSGRASYRICLWWATATTFCGSVTSVYVALQLLHRFSGAGLVPHALVASPTFVLSVIIAAALTVFLATRLGFPISTTHAILGGLLGAGVIAVGPSRLSLAKLEHGFVLPLLLSPVIAVVLAICLFRAVQLLPRGPRIIDYLLRPAVVAPATGPKTDLDAGMPPLMVAVTPDLAVFPEGMTRSGSPLTSALDAAGSGQTRSGVDLLHFVSAGLVSFARGLNDTPKMGALLLLVPRLSPSLSVSLVGLLIAVGGLLGARRVAETMSHRISSLSPAEGLGANLSTSALVVSASFFGLPVSTTHVAVGSVFGVGLSTGSANARVVSSIILSWIVTLPCAAILASFAYFSFVELG